MGGSVVIIILLVLVVPVVIIMSGLVVAGLFGSALNKDVNRQYEGTELLALSESN